MLESGFAGFEERYGGRPVSEGTGAPVMVLCRIAVAAGGVAKSSFQDVNGERSEAFMALDAHLLDRVEALGAEGVTADSLADGLDRLAAGTLAPEALRLHLMRLPADEAEMGVILLVAGAAIGRRDYRPGVELGELRSEALSQETLQSLLASLAAARLPELPARLPAPDVYRLRQGVAARGLGRSPSCGRAGAARTGLGQRARLVRATGYTKGVEGIMREFDRGYSEVTFSKVAVEIKADEAIIHKEFHLSSADPEIVGAGNTVIVGKTNYDVADQLADVGMEAIHPKAAKPMELAGISIRLKNTFEPDHPGTLITKDFVGEKARIEVIAGTTKVTLIEIHDPSMVGTVGFDLDLLRSSASTGSRTSSRPPTRTVHEMTEERIVTLTLS